MCFLLGNPGKSAEDEEVIMMDESRVRSRRGRSRKSHCRRLKNPEAAENLELPGFSQSQSNALDEQIGCASRSPGPARAKVGFRKRLILILTRILIQTHTHTDEARNK